MKQLKETTQTPELDDTVIVQGYMPLDTQVEITKIDLSTLSEIYLPSEAQTIQQAYEVSLYQTKKKAIDENGNEIAIENATEGTTIKEERIDMIQVSIMSN